MFEKCTSCNSRILGGGEEFLHWRFCGESCCARFKTELAERLMSEEEIEQNVLDVFEGACPQCGEVRGNDVFSATKVTGMLVMYQINSQSQLCCASCARKNRLLAAMHCLFLGWWSPRAAFCNLFVLPTNLIALLFVRTPEQPSAEVTSLVKLRIAEMLAPQMAAQLREAEAGPVAAEDEAPA